MIIDAHTHLLPKEILEKYSQKSATGGSTALGYSLTGDVETLIEEMNNANVDVSVLVADAYTSSETIAEAVNKYPDRLIGFASVDPLKGKEAATQLETAITSLGLKGLKLLPYIQHFYPNDKKVYPVYEKAQELGIPLLIHSGASGRTFDPDKYNQPIFLDDVALDFPNLVIIAAHGIKWNWHDETSMLLRKHPNLYIDTAAMASSGTRSLAWLTLSLYKEIIGEEVMDRILFGSDFPAYSPQQNIDALLAAKDDPRIELFGFPPITDEDIKKILGENAKNLLKI